MNGESNPGSMPIKIEVKLHSADIRKAFEKVLDVFAAPLKNIASSRAVASTDRYISNRIESKDIAKLACSEGISLPEARKLALRGEALHIFRAARDQKNIEATIERAIALIEGPVTDSKLDSDWFFDWIDGCKNVTDQEIRDIWAKLLSGELVQSGTFSRRTLGHIRLLSREEAVLFSKLCGCLVKAELDTGNDYIHLRTNAATNKTIRYGLSLGDWLRLEQAGLIILNTNHNISVATPFKLHYRGKMFKIDVLRPEELPADQRLAFDAFKGKSAPGLLITGVKCYFLTAVGNELAKICDPIQNDEYLADLMLTIRFNYPGARLAITNSPKKCPLLSIYKKCLASCEVRSEGECYYIRSKN